MEDYRQSQFRKDWWNEKVWMVGMMITRNDLAWIVVGFMIALILFKFPLNWDFVFGLR